MTNNNLLPLRSAVPQEQTWNLESVFPTPADWEAACQEIEGSLPALSAYQGRLSEGPAVLLEFLALYQHCAALVKRIYYFSYNASSVDTADSAAAARLGQVFSLSANFSAAVAFFEPELIRIGFDRLYTWMQAEPELVFIAHYVDSLKHKQAHVRSDEIEQVLALVSDPFSGAETIYEMLNDADLIFKPAVASDGSEEELGQSSIDRLITEADRELRRSAWENYADGYLAYRNTFSAALTTAVKQHVFYPRARKYPSRSRLPWMQATSLWMFITT